MGFINVDLDQNYEDELVPEGRYPLRIEAADEKTAKDGSDQIVCRISVQDSDYPNAGTIFHYLTAPGPDDDADKIRFKSKFIARFINTFSVPLDGDGFNSEDLPGLEGEALVVQTEMKDKEGKSTGEMRNELRLDKVEDAVE